ncbi:cobyrinate a,c-diamide synthase [Candidatus Acidulodesulfobacterium sp. H_13]|uniref:cobyrinate a,c-diamide synthase n=1 Tax=Candidatus Acidulodesulfobacterium sp. H_13 TaxID=3395470 RepID=UPI003AF61D6B
MFSVYFASDRSSSGKSTVTLAFSKMLRDLGYSLNIYKTGPDFIDPAVLARVLNLDVKNLDPFLIPNKYLTEWFLSENDGNENTRETEKVFVVESAMGLYDGNSYEIAKKFKLPVVLVMDSKRISSTMASLVFGLKRYKKGVNVCGVILNNISSERHYEIISEEIKKNISGVEVFGYILNNESVFSIKERHLGLIIPDGKSGKMRLEKIAEDIKRAVFKNIKLDLLIKTLKENSNGFNDLFSNHRKRISESRRNKKNAPIYKKIKIAVAQDKAFFFYYNFNMEILKSFGAEIVFFSPCRDKALPKGVKAVYIGGGYPEIYARDLAENRAIIGEIYKFFENNGIIYAECGGLMYLCEKITYKHKSFDMTGVFPLEASLDNARLSLGYRTIRFKEKTFFGESGLMANGHEFHYSKLINIDGSDDNKRDYKKVLEYERLNSPGRFKSEGYNILNAIGSYIHLSFFSNKLLAKNFLDSARKS